MPKPKKKDSIETQSEQKPAPIMAVPEGKNQITSAAVNAPMKVDSSDETTEFDVIVIGGGPSGSSTTTFLSKAGKKVLLLDKQKFPRDKTCGDGISGRSVRMLTEMGVYPEFKNVEHLDMYGVTFSSPNGTVAPVSSPKKENGSPPGFVCRREVFDNVLFQNAKKLATRTIEGFVANDLVMEGSKVVGVKGLVNGKEQVFKAKVVVGADGAGGMTSRKLNAYHNEEDHLCAGIRCYYENVGGMIDQIELHFVKEALPGYFWIFPLPNGKANVGIGMVVTDMKKKKVNLQKVMFDIIENNPTFKDRFKNAKRTTEVKSWLLPFASKRVKMSGDGYLLVGDAASLIDPFTGEGIGNALTSGRAASAAIVEALNKNDFSASSLKKYEDLLMADIEKEVKDNYKLQKMVKGEFLLNLIVGRAKKSKYVQGVISNALINPDEHSTLSDPLFFFKALFAP